MLHGAKASSNYVQSCHEFFFVERQPLAPFFSNPLHRNLCEGPAETFVQLAILDMGGNLGRMGNHEVQKRRAITNRCYVSAFWTGRFASGDRNQDRIPTEGIFFQGPVALSKLIECRPGQLVGQARPVSESANLCFHNRFYEKVIKVKADVAALPTFFVLCGFRDISTENFAYRIAKRL
jgi:hypothetical protein